MGYLRVLSSVSCILWEQSRFGGVAATITFDPSFYSREFSRNFIVT